MKKIQIMKDQFDKVVIPSSKTYDFVAMENIVRCEGMQNYCKIHLTDGSTMLSSCNLGVFKKALKDFGFYCPHKSHLVNSVHIVRYHKLGEVEMSDGTNVPVSRRKKDQFFSEIMNALKINSVCDNC